MFGWFKREKVVVRVRIKPLKGLGANRKEALKFLKKFCKKCGNYEAVRSEIESSRHINGTLDLIVALPKGKAKAMEKRAEKLGSSAEVYASVDHVHINKKEKNIVKHHTEQNNNWVVTQS